ncbi:SDR family oxidoreductase [Streptomyces sp. NRRL S-340]|uniref:SDR family oxidoreductase n=1 Tax=Streptomyces sp. NRRL S-340 TaxID=1463901 RepID=UPI00055F82A3|nr:SDR family oxidoreductase [Streptomyces sp. NRRL S-340]
MTGAGRGLGEAMARRAAADGYRVVVAELNPAWGERTAEAIRAAGGEAESVPLDVADPASVAALAGRLAAAGPASGPLYGLVNNAALANGVGGKEFQDIDVEVWDRLMAVNARGPWLVAKHLLPLMTRPGRIVNIASDAALYGSPRLAHYIASKGAVLSLTRGMARELGEQGITVNALAPGLTEAEATATVPAERHALYAVNRAISRPQQPEDLLGLVSFLLGEESRYVTGQVIAVNGGFTMH